MYQVYIPPSRDSPGGFRSLEERSDAFSLTYTLYQKAKVKDAAVQVADKQFIQLYPIRLAVKLVSVIHVRFFYQWFPEMRSISFPSWH